jgi:hypothetical protein
MQPLAIQTTERDAYRSIVDEKRLVRARGFADRLGREVTKEVVPANLTSVQRRLRADMGDPRMSKRAPYSAESNAVSL